MKFVRTKTALLTAAMALSLATPAFAADTKTEQTLKVGSTTRVPIISMQMPTAPAIVMNPYKLKVTIDKEKDIQEQVASNVMKVVNLSECDIQVGVQASVKVAGVALVATTTNTKKATGDINDVWINLSGQVGDNTTALTKSDLYTNTSGVLTAKSGVATLNLTAADQDLSTDFAYGTVPTAKLATTLVAGNGTKAGTGNGTFYFAFWGDATTDKAWTEKCTVTPTVSFKFTPLADTPTS